MQKEKTKTVTNPVGATSSRPHFEEIAKKQNQKGITLIALIITIIVMLILVGVTVTVSLNGGLFNTAEKSKIETLIEREKEQLLEVAMGALGENRRVDFEELENNLPDIFTKVGERTYKSNVTGKTYMVNEYGSITMVEDVVEGPFKLKAELSKENPFTLLISYEIPGLTEENITDEQTINIIAQSLGISEEIESYEDLYLRVAQMLTGNEELTDEQLLAATGKPEPTTQDVFLYLMEQASQMEGMEALAQMETPQQLALSLSRWSFLYINGSLYEEARINYGDTTKIETTYTVATYGTYEICVEVDGIRDEVTIEVPKPTLKEEELELKVELSKTSPLTLLISYEIPESYNPEAKKLSINGEDKTTLINGKQAEYTVEEFGKYEISLEIDEIKATKTIEINGQLVAEKSNWDLNKTEVKTEELTIVPIPKGFEVLKTAEKPQGYTIDEGLVITDGENEFVWIPVASKFISPYNSSSNYSEPTELTYDDSNSGADYDSQATLNHYYGEGHFTYPQTAEEKANVNNTFAYAAHYKEMIDSVNKYGGFYIGRYETTIDGTNIGSKVGATVLTADQTLEQTNNKEVRWWGLYAVQRNANVVGNGNIVQTNMIWGQQWDAMISYFDNKNKDYSKTQVATLATSRIVQNAGQAQYTYDSKTISDEICNIFDLRGNTYDWTAEASYVYDRVSLGGDYFSRHSASYRSCYYPGYDDFYLGSRLTLYIK